MGRGYIASSHIAMFNDYLDEMIALCGDQAEKPLIDGKTLIEAGFSDHHFYKQLLAEAYDLQLAGYQRDAILRRLKGER
jgi:tRNA nucleotidyltransferase (CCA-adding enzyme)